MTSNFAKKEDQSTFPHHNSTAAAYSRDRVNTGRVENLRSMGNDLMRPASRDGTKNPSMLASNQEESAQQKMRNSSSGFYQPSAKFTYLSEFDRTNENYQNS